MSINWDQYAVVAFIDANIALEGLALEQLPWKELDKVGPILVLVTPTVMREVDSKKLNQRLGDHARRFNKTLRPLIAGQDCVVVRPSPPPRVDLALADCPPVDWSQYSALDREEPDARIVGEALATRGPPADRRVVVSHDIRPLQLARQHDFKGHHVGDNWLRPKEVSEADKKAANLQRELEAIKSREPKLELSFTIRSQPSRAYRVRDLDPGEREQIEQTILALHPMPTQAKAYDPLRLTPFVYTGFDATLKGRYQRYKSEVLPEFMRQYERKLETAFGQMEIIIHVKNVGQVPALALLVHITATGGWLNTRWVSVHAGGPSAPSVREHSLFTPPLMTNVRSALPPPRHDFVATEEPHRSSTAELACTDFRHGSAHEYRLVGWADPHAKEFRIEAVATASNLHGDVRNTLVVSPVFQEASVEDLVDLATMKLKVPSDVLELLHQANTVDEYQQFEFDGSDSDN